MKIQYTNDIKNIKSSFLIYGKSGVGKTTLATTIGNDSKVFIINAEGGLRSIEGSRIASADVNLDDDGKPLGVDAKYKRLQELVSFLKKPEQLKQFDWVVVDSLTEISKIVYQYQEIQANKKENLTQKGEVDGFAMWRNYNSSISKFLRAFRHTNVIFLALSKYEDENKVTAPALESRSMREESCAMVDFVFYFKVDEEIKEEKGKKTITQKRRLYTKANPAYTAKDRSGKLSAIEPNSLALILKKIYTKKAQKHTEKNPF